MTPPSQTELASSEAPEEIFHPFSVLPAELRLKIWNLFLHATRPTPITIMFTPRNSSFGTPGRPAEVQMWEADDSVLHRGKQIPAILHVCHESRDVGQGYYVIGFEVSEELRALPFNHCWKRLL